MKSSERVWRIGTDVVGVVPRAHAALRSDGWNPLSSNGLRLLAEVVMDENLLTQLRTGQTATFIIFQTPEEGIGFPINLKGFGEGLDSLP